MCGGGVSRERGVDEVGSHCGGRCGGGDNGRPPYTPAGIMDLLVGPWLNHVSTHA